jgi:transposase
MGRTKGGLNTKIHALVNARSQALVIALSAGNDADVSLAEELTECLPEDSTLIGDKAYDSSTLRQAAGAKGIKTCIPARSNRTTTPPFSRTAYRRRHRIENFFERIKRYRRVATRYDKLAETFLGFVCPSHFVHSSPQINDLQTDPRSVPVLDIVLALSETKCSRIKMIAHGPSQ